MTPGPWALAAPHAACAEAGAAVLREGGTAVDAALATTAALCVAYPHMCALGGDLFALLGAPDGEVAVVNGSGAAPRALSAEAVRAPLWRGVDAVTVPGMVRGWESLWRLGGRSPWERLLAPAAAMARDGVVVVPGVARALREHRDVVAADSGLRAGFGDAAVGDVVRQPALAATLDAVAAGGADAFYSGDIAEALVAGLRALGSVLSGEDLATHRSERLVPLVASFRGDEVLTAPPNSQGFVLPAILDGLEAGDPLDPVLARRFADASVLRDRTLGDPGRADGDTVAVVAADAEGWTISLIASLFSSFGAGILEPRTGVLLHNRGACFSLEAGSPNRLAGGRRPAHTLMPVLVRRAGEVVGAHGTMGGRAQPQIHAQLLLRLAAGATPAEAVAAPRMVVEDGVAVVEGRERAEPLRAAGFDVTPLDGPDEETGHAQLVRRAAGDAGWVAATDPRADGAALTG